MKQLQQKPHGLKSSAFDSFGSSIGETLQTSLRKLVSWYMMIDHIGFGEGKDAESFCWCKNKRQQSVLQSLKNSCKRPIKLSSENRKDIML